MSYERLIIKQKEEVMKNIKFREQVTNGDKATTLKWSRITDKDELLIEIFTSEELFEDLATYWRDLEKRSFSKVCMSFDWIYNWWQRFGKNEQRSLYIITFWDGTKLVGLAPLYKGYSKFSGSTLEIRLQLIGSGGSPNEQIGYTNDNGISNFLDILVDNSYADVVADRLKEVLTPEFLGVDVVKFHHVSDTSFVMNHLYPRLDGKRRGMSLKQMNTSPYIDLAQQKILKDYVESKKSNGHSEYPRSSVKKPVIKDVTTSWKTVEDAINKMIELHKSQRKQLGLPGLFDDKRSTEFFKDIIKSAYQDDRLWFKQSLDENGVYASRIAIKYDDCYYDYISGMSDFWAHSKYRTDVSLLTDLIEDAISNGVRRVESLRSEESDRYDFISGSFKNWKLTIPFHTKKPSVFLLINRIKAFFYRYFV